ncbi:hypothetical protein ACOSP7_023398 [Xanthoceras sorbifolium]
MVHRKTPMKKTIEARKMYFSKRRSGLFKKASELCILCAVEAAIFIFGNPCVDTTVNKLRPGMPDSCLSQRTQADHEATMDALNKEYAAALEKLKAEEKRGEELEQINKAFQGPRWLVSPVEELSLDDLLMKEKFLDDLHVKIQKRMEELQGQTSTASSAATISPPATNPDGGGPVSKED